MITGKTLLYARLHCWACLYVCFTRHIVKSVIGLCTVYNCVQQDKTLFHMQYLLEIKHANLDSYGVSHNALDAWCMMVLSISIPVKDTLSVHLALSTHK